MYNTYRTSTTHDISSYNRISQREVKRAAQMDFRPDDSDALGPIRMKTRMVCCDGLWQLCDNVTICSVLHVELDFIREFLLVLWPVGCGSNMISPHFSALTRDTICDLDRWPQPSRS